MTQLGFGFDQRFEEEQAAHLPAEMERAIPLYRTMIERHNAAMLAADTDEVQAIRKEAHRLAVKLNRGSPAIMGSDDAPAYVLERTTAAPAGTVPLWGQTGEFTIDVAGTPVRIELDGIFGIGTSTGFWPGFSIHAVDKDKPFPSETGYRSFLGCRADIVPGITPPRFCEAMVDAYLKGECKGRMRPIKPEYRGR